MKPLSTTFYQFPPLSVVVGLGILFFIDYNLLWHRETLESYGVVGKFLWRYTDYENFNISFVGFIAGAHIFEGIFAYMIADAKGLNLTSCLFWFVQTTIFGYPSMKILIGYKSNLTKRKKSGNYYQTPSLFGALFTVLFWFIVAGSAYGGSEFFGQFQWLTNVPYLPRLIQYYLDSFSELA